MFKFPILSSCCGQALRSQARNSVPGVPPGSIQYLGVYNYLFCPVLRNPFFSGRSSLALCLLPFHNLLSPGRTLNQKLNDFLMEPGDPYLNFPCGCHLVSSQRVVGLCPDCCCVPRTLQSSWHRANSQ